MKSVRFRKLMHGIKLPQQQLPNHYQVTVSPGVSCQCFIEYWNEDKLKSMGQYLSVRSLLEHFSESFELPEQMLGKKSSEIILSNNQRYCLKLINQEDLETLANIIEAYCDFKKSHKNSMLIHILGVVVLHTIHQNKTKWIDSFLIMPNLKTKTTMFFDIKGHCDNRFVPVNDFKDFGFGKDQNFIKSTQKKLLQHVSRQAKQQIYSNISADLQFLRKCEVIDYSLIIIFNEIKPNIAEDRLKWYQINQNTFVSFIIIDYLQEFNERKKLQNKFKSLFYKEISSVDPESYAKRLLEFTQKHIFSQLLLK